jgi:hypothetical protein
MWGELSYDLTGWGTADGKLRYEGPDYVTGGVQGCGTGSYIVDDYDGYIDLTKYDPVTNSAPGFNRWRVRAGSGTGQLTNLVSGEGVNYWRDYLAGDAGLAPYLGVGDFTGTITCWN